MEGVIVINDIIFLFFLNLLAVEENIHANLNGEASCTIETIPFRIFVGAFVGVECYIWSWRCCWLSWCRCCMRSWNCSTCASICEFEDKKNCLKYYVEYIFVSQNLDSGKKQNNNNWFYSFAWEGIDRGQT